MSGCPASSRPGARQSQGIQVGMGAAAAEAARSLGRDWFCGAVACPQQHVRRHARGSKDGMLASAEREASLVVVFGERPSMMYPSKAVRVEVALQAFAAASLGPKQQQQQQQQRGGRRAVKTPGRPARPPRRARPEQQLPG